MANDNQIAVKKRLIYAEDLFEPVDFTVLQMGGRSGGKTMAMYEQLFRKRVEMAPTVDAVEVVRCKDCIHYCQTRAYGSTYMGCEVFDGANEIPYETEPDDFCSYGERKV